MKLSIDNGLSRCRAAHVMCLLFFCGQIQAGIDDVWAASPATQDTAWAQQYAAPVNPAISGAGLSWGPIIESGGVNYDYMQNDNYTSLCPDGYVLVGFRRTEHDWFYFQCRQITLSR